MKSFKIILPLIIILGLFISCKKDDDNGGGGLTEFLFPVEDDVELGQQLADHIAANPEEFPVLPRETNLELYQKVEAIRDSIIKSEEIVYREEFAWEVKIIKQDVLNAFAAPGGFIYVYTGLIEYLDSEDHFAGVMGHEVAHADRRHTVNQQIKNSGVSLLLSALLGESSAVTSLASGLLSLRHSRVDESDADEWSVRYLCSTVYNGNGAAGFFRKIEAESEDGSSQPEFLSTHPDPDNRVENIDGFSDDLGCPGTSEGEEWLRTQELSRNSTL